MGQISYAHEIWNYPGYEQINGTALVQKMMAQAIKAGAELKQAEADSIKKKGKSFIVKTSENTYESRAIILASGLKHRKLNIKGEKEFTGKGVSYCVTCDGHCLLKKTLL